MKKITDFDQFELGRAFCWLKTFATHSNLFVDKIALERLLQEGYFVHVGLVGGNSVYFFEMLYLPRNPHCFTTKETTSVGYLDLVQSTSLLYYQSFHK